MPIYDIQLEEHVKVPMRDGTLLDATIWRPSRPGTYPVLLERDAYENMNRSQSRAEFYASRGYVFIKQNVRGSYASQGNYAWFRADAWGEHQDGHDSVQWAGRQSWSNGKVGMIGGSYSGMTQYLTAPTRPSYLRALFVRYATPNVHTLLYRSGAFSLTCYLGIVLYHTLEDLLPADSGRDPFAEQKTKLANAIERIDEWRNALPLTPLPPLEGTPYAKLMYDEPLCHPDYDDYWRPLNMLEKCSQIDVPILHFGGWFDSNLAVMLESFSTIRSDGATEECRRGQRLVIGPWIHTELAGRKAGEVDFGPDAEIDLEPARLPWYDHWLKDLDNGILNEPPVRVFLMGVNRWLDLEDWPPPNANYRALYLHKGSGNSDHSLNNGRLSFAPPEGSQKPDNFTYDPSDPVPSLVEYPDLGPRDYQGIEHRLLTYTSEMLETDLVLVGPVTATLFAMSSAPDTDWVVRLCDVHPDGRSISICDGILRSRYRNSPARQELLEPNTIYQFKVDLWATAHCLKVGHRLRVHVTSSDFPRYDRNLNTGGPFGCENRGQVAINTIFLDRDRASYLRLPVLPD